MFTGFCAFRLPYYHSAAKPNASYMVECWPFGQLHHIPQHVWGDIKLADFPTGFGEDETSLFLSFQCFNVLSQCSMVSFVSYACLFVTNVL